jgi:hypothetical protein
MNHIFIDLLKKLSVNLTESIPNNNSNYSNTVIYKIYCKDKNINDIYVGNTTNFQARKYHHKLAYENCEGCLKIYKTIRENGGWDNWDIEEIAQI